MADKMALELSDKELEIGCVFTPPGWAEFAIEKFNIFEKWINDKTIFDPTMGEGNLLDSLISFGLSKGYTLNELPLQNLFGNELNTFNYNKTLAKFTEKYNLDFRDNFTNEDILKLNPRKFDVIFGNPPWQNFVDLPETYKSQIKKYFFEYDLVGRSQDLLLGGSRIDIAALIIQVAIKNFLKHNGEAVFFLPLSLFLNEGANRSFRTYCINEIDFSIQAIYDFNDIDVFDKVSTRYGLCHFLRDQKMLFPIPYFRFELEEWKEYLAKPVFKETDPLSIYSLEKNIELNSLFSIVIAKESKPRQGINTCGANKVFFFNCMNSIQGDLVTVSNNNNNNITLPKRFVYPLLTANDFKSENCPPSKWVLLPYRQDGKPLEWEDIIQFPELKSYLEEHEELLQSRKGVMITSFLKRGYWWAMLGVGPYNFFPCKIVWEAYGKTSFNPKVFMGNWQANQSLQAYIPVKTLSEAERIIALLSDKRIVDYLHSMKMEGTMNWAQPGKIKKFLKYADKSDLLYSFS